MPRIPLRVIPEPEKDTRTILALSDEGTVVMRGDATGHDYTCGNCGAVLLAGVRRAQVRDLVLKCNGCGAFNDTAQFDA